MKMHSFSANQRGVIVTFTLLIDEHELYAYKTHGTESSRHIHTPGTYFEQVLLWSLPRILGVFYLSYLNISYTAPSSTKETKIKVLTTVVT